MYAGINDTIFERDEVKSTYNMEKEEIDAWISGSPVAKSAVKEYTEMRAAGSSEGKVIQGLKVCPSHVANLELLRYFYSRNCCQY